MPKISGTAGTRVLVVNWAHLCPRIYLPHGQLINRSGLAICVLERLYSAAIGRYEVAPSLRAGLSCSLCTAFAKQISKLWLKNYPANEACRAEST